MTVEKELPIEKIINRKDFGPGRAGDWAYQIVLSSEPCETWIDEKHTKCGKHPVGTVDIDVLGDLEFFSVCGPEHRLLLENQLMDELREQGRTTIPSYNGFGREYDKPGPYEKR